MSIYSAKNISVIVCVKNEENRIVDCLRSVVSCQPNEIIVIDGDSKDSTARLALNYTNNVIITKSSNLTRDRQIGIDAASNDIIAMIDADHRLVDDSLNSLLKDLMTFKFDIVQSQLKSYINNNFWNAAEEQFWDLTHNRPGPKKMIGVAPALYKKKIFSIINFDDSITKTIDDTDFIYRLSQHENINYGIGTTKIKQLHNGSLQSYLKKFKWYGIGDSEFCRKHPRRAFSMVYHLLIRYPIIYSTKSLLKGKFRAFPFLIIQGITRFYGLIVGIVSNKK
jgi:glycosyltransferase involved in cell wall biosynthesis